MSTVSALMSPPPARCFTLPSEPIIGQLDVITNRAAKEELRKEREPQQPRDKVANGNAECTLRGKRGSESRCHSLLALEKRHQTLLIASEGRAVIAPAIAKLARKHVCLRHREPRAFAGHEGDTGRGIADQRGAPFCPAIHANLADAVEVDVAGARHGCGLLPKNWSRWYESL